MNLGLVIFSLKSFIVNFSDFLIQRASGVHVALSGCEIDEFLSATEFLCRFMEQ